MSLSLKAFEIGLIINSSLPHLNDHPMFFAFMFFFIAFTAQIVTFVFDVRFPHWIVDSKLPRSRVDFVHH